MDKRNIRHELRSLDEFWSQRILGEANGTLIKVAKGIGEVNWHKHEDQDEVFIVYKGRLTIRLRSGDVELEEGEMFVVPKGVEHAPRADDEVELLVLGVNVTSNEAGGKPEWSYSQR
jgi:mannose-6-phosphate isomerase-like protein (cupin superfamily)